MWNVVIDGPEAVTVCELSLTGVVPWYSQWAAIVAGDDPVLLVDTTA
jgi:hypothetical protein